MRDECALYFCCAEAVPGDVQHIVDAAYDPEVPVCIAASAVTGKIHPFDLAPVSRFVARLVAPDAAQHPRPRLADDELAALIRPEFLAVVADDRRVHAEERQRRRPRFARRAAGQRRDHVAARLRLPPRIHDGAARAADGLVIPHPRFGIDHLAHCAEQAQ